MPYYETFKLNKDFKRLYGRGKSIVLPHMVVYYKRNNLDHCRVGITVSKKIGCAVKRNRAKRVIRAAFSKIMPKLGRSYDFVFAARVRTTFIKSTVLYNALFSALKKEGIINEKNFDLSDPTLPKKSFTD